MLNDKVGELNHGAAALDSSAQHHEFCDEGGFRQQELTLDGTYRKVESSSSGQGLILQGISTSM